MAAFDTWLDNEDRANDGNLLVNKNTDDGKPTCFAYIDYSYSMAKLWRGGKYTNIVPRPIFPTDAKDANVEIISRAISRIESLSETAIREIVNRVPDDFLSPADRDLIIEGLLHRQTRIRPVLRAIYGGIP